MSARAAKTSEEKRPSTQEQVVNLLNEAQHSKDGQAKVIRIKQVHELIIHQDPALLDNFLDEMLSFMNDTIVDVRKLVLNFIEEACKKDPEILPKIVPNLLYMLSSDQNVNVQKRVINACTHLYPMCLKWVSESRKISLQMETCWEEFAQLKGRILIQLDSDNEGIKTHVIKFVEGVIMVQSAKTQDSEPGKPDAIALEVIPRDHRLLSYRKLEAEGRALVDKLLDLMGRPHISSVNLMTCMGSLTSIARNRPAFMEKVVLALETLHVNLPPTLAKSQVSSVRKALKLHLLNLLRHPASMSFHPQITTLLTDLGATQQQVLKALPASSQLKRRIRKTEDEGPGKKRTKDEVEDDDKDEEESEDKEVKERKNNAIDITAEYLNSKLSPHNVADLVLLTMVVLPDSMPPQFQSSYTPIAAAGTEAQIRHLARLMATQFTAADVGPGVEQVKKEAAERMKSHTQRKLGSQANLDVPATPKLTIETMVGMATAGSASTSKAGQGSMGPPGAKTAGGKQQPLYGAQSSKVSKRMQQFGLVHVTQPLSVEQQYKMTQSAFDRILGAEKRALQGGAASGAQAVMVRIASRFNLENLQNKLEMFILADQKNRADLAVLWVFEEYAQFQGFTVQIDSEKQAALFDRYDKTLCRMLSKLFEKGEHKESLFHKLLLESPFVTPNALDLLKQACMDKVYGQFGLSTLREMILTRPKQRTELVSALLDFTCFERADFRSQCLNICKELYTVPWIQHDIHTFGTIFLHHLLEPNPPLVLFGQDRGRPETKEKWEEETVKACLYLYLHLLPVDHSLIQELATVYVDTPSDTKRVILRHLEIPLKAIGMHSVELLKLVDNCPKGAETLVTRIVHLLTERSAPTVALVSKVYALYKERVPDVRCLIPVLTGLPKAEILLAIPKLIKLNPNVVKEVFNRLLFGKGLETGHPPMTPTELLVNLHNQELNTQEELKHVLAAMNLLLSQKQVYTKEVMAVVIQQLLDQSELPDLMMRTTIQAIAAYPTLIGFVINVLHRLVAKKVWTNPKMWEGFMRCCQKTTPQSFQILLELPPRQLKDLFLAVPDIREPLLDHIGSLSSHQQSQIRAEIVEVLQMDPADYNKLKDVKLEPTNQSSEEAGFSSEGGQIVESSTAATTATESETSQESSTE